MNYIKNAIGSAAYRAMAQNCGISSFTPADWSASYQRADLDGNVVSVITACLANTTLATANNTATEGDINVECARAATAAALANVQFTNDPAPSSAELAALAANIATLFTAWTNNIATTAGTASNYIRNAIGAAAYEALTINKGISAGVGGLPQVSTGSIETDLDDQVAAIMQACHVNASILGLEPSTEASFPVKAIRAAVLAIFSNLGTDGVSSTELTALAALVYEVFNSWIQGSASINGTAAAVAAFAAMGADRGISSGAAPQGNTDLTTLYNCITAFLAACESNTSFAAYDQSAKGSVLLSGIFATALNGKVLNLTVGGSPGTITLGSYISAAALLTAINTVGGWTGIATQVPAAPADGVLLLTKSTGLIVTSGSANVVLGLEESIGSSLTLAIEAATAILLQNLDLEPITNPDTFLEPTPPGPAAEMTNLINLLVTLINEINTIIS